jgi:hypothetical protein
MLPASATSRPVRAGASCTSATKSDEAQARAGVLVGAGDGAGRRARRRGGRSGGCGRGSGSRLLSGLRRLLRGLLGRPGDAHLLGRLAHLRGGCGDLPLRLSAGGRRGGRLHGAAGSRGTGLGSGRAHCRGLAASRAGCLDLRHGSGCLMAHAGPSARQVQGRCARPVQVARRGVCRGGRSGYGLGRCGGRRSGAGRCPGQREGECAGRRGATEQRAGHGFSCSRVPPGEAVHVR